MIGLSRRISNLSPSATLAITSRAKKMRSNGLDIVNFAAGEPDLAPPQYIGQAANKAIAENFIRYTPSSGIPELKEAIRKKFLRDNNLCYEQEQVFVANGAKQCLFNLIQALVDSRDEVIIPAPYWVSYPEMVKFAGGAPIIACGDKDNSFKLNPCRLKQLVSQYTRLLILNSPCNPAGYIYNKNELEDIADICVERNIAVISDEIYENIVYEGRHISIASLGKKIYDLAFTVNGVSKAYAMTGWRIGYLGGNKDVVSAIGRLQDHSTSCACSVAQMAALAALSSDGEWLREMAERFARRRKIILSLLDKIGLPYVRPRGAFYVFCNISKTGLRSQEFCRKLLEEKYVAAIPGAAFGCDDYIRISFATGSQDIEKGMRRLQEFCATAPSDKSA
ncbi:MAG: pyridoxal phosphate-dependent aminotransferase [Candidatus Omnitrophota bacterium]